MKKYLIAIMVILVAAAMILVPLLKSDPEIVEPTEDAPALFTFKENLITKFGDEISIEAEILSDEVKFVKAVFDDTVLFEKENPTGKVSFPFNGTYRGVGAKKFNLEVTLKDGTEFVDNRIVRVLSDVIPEQLQVNIVKTYPHLTTNFTQGLEFYKGKLFESTGQYGQSFVAEVDINSGAVNENRKMGLDATHFGEGITILNDVIYQLTWQKQKCITYDLGDNIVPKSEFNYIGEGWGLTNDGTYLIMSNGSERITFRNPKTFLVERTIEVYDEQGPRLALNELEYIDGKIYANVWQSADVLVIDPETGRVLQVIDGTNLLIGQGPDREVMNGIAFDENTGRIFMTGKNWKSLFQVEFVKVAS